MAVFRELAFNVVVSDLDYLGHFFTKRAQHEWKPGYVRRK